MTAKLIDFGIAFLVDDAQMKTNQTVFQVTHRGAIGTPGYLCPRYSNTKQYGERSEVYSFGIVLLELFTGEVQLHEEVNIYYKYIEPDGDDEIDLKTTADVRAGRWPEEAVEEIADIIKLCLGIHNKRPTMMPILRRLMGLEN